MRNSGTKREDLVEQIIRLHLNDWTNVAIADNLQVGYFIVTREVNRFKEQLREKPNAEVQLAALRKMESRLIELAERGGIKTKEYEVLLSCYASADINNFSVLDTVSPNHPRNRCCFNYCDR